MARVLVLGVALAGLFLMHGMSAHTGLSCAAAAPAITAHDHDHATGHRHAWTDSTAHAGCDCGFDAAATGHGAICVSTPPHRGSAVLPGLLIVAVIALADGPGRLARRGVLYGRSGRAPPVGGAKLLTAVCVSRT